MYYYTEYNHNFLFESSQDIQQILAFGRQLKQKKTLHGCNEKALSER